MSVLNESTETSGIYAATIEVADASAEAKSFLFVCLDKLFLFLEKENQVAV